LSKSLKRTCEGIATSVIAAPNEVRADVVIVLSTVLRIKRTLDSSKIDKITWDVGARRAFAMESQRRSDWRKSKLTASRFRFEVARLPSRR
jgi:hypothetical protein